MYQLVKLLFPNCKSFTVIYSSVLQWERDGKLSVNINVTFWGWTRMGIKHCYFSNTGPATDFELVKSLSLMEYVLRKMAWNTCMNTMETHLRHFEPALRCLPNISKVAFYKTASGGYLDLSIWLKINRVPRMTEWFQRLQRLKTIIESNLDLKHPQAKLPHGSHRPNF